MDVSVFNNQLYKLSDRLSMPSMNIMEKYIGQCNAVGVVPTVLGFELYQEQIFCVRLQDGGAEDGESETVE